MNPQTDTPEPHASVNTDSANLELRFRNGSEHLRRTQLCGLENLDDDPDFLDSPAASRTGSSPEARAIKAGSRRR